MLTDPRTGDRRELTADPLSVDDAVAAARAAFPVWSGLTPRYRSRRLLALAEAIESNGDAFVAAERAGTGKPLADAVSEVETAADVLRFYAGALRAELTPASGHRLPGHESWVRWEPLGVVAAIVPWNYPLLMAMWRIGPALAAGNTVVLKPAETTPDSALLLARFAREILGADVLVALPGDRETGRRLVESAVDMVAFTGSQRGGLDVSARAGLRRVSLELGGNCAAIVLPDAPAGTYDAIVAACTYNAGQSCAAPARVLALRENYDEVVQGLADAMAARHAGPDFGPLNNPDQAARLDDILSRTAAGVQRVGGLRLAEGEAGGYWRAGRILADLPADDPAVVEEVFGPVLTVQAASGPGELIHLANGVPQALAASVWGTNMGPAMTLAAALDCGEVWLNCHLEQTAELPHGGRRASGQGTDLSVLALAEYQRPKTITARLTL
ncbi:gamma-aminobutyraldehyde dehydrogenase [Virgisporangium aliadipatigenens]|uniref:Gamma-aminobutyraldehyde dehydrogenase n=1 Tax=Virgisporangium aliadipatigenens TaxID=741659 RepID=A0A8J3YIB2_9ACTN|nr:aldehyde dehydrogenase family protein [Virgisporangium aliadipatigenens]GIJ44490.1 gamma-aminobutyraldehyde dehydrogenase [Virgisporangium aliadipatigenens]